MEIAGLRNRAFWIFHGIWALLWIGATIYLLSIPKSGDMPASLLIVFTIPAGLLGHGFILLIAFLKRVGDKLVLRRSGQPAVDWPWLMLVIALVLLVTTLKMGYQFNWVNGIHYIHSPVFPKLMLLMLVKLASLLGLLLRQPWSRWLIIGFFSYWFLEALYMAYQYWNHYPGFRPAIYTRPFGYALLSVILVVALVRSRSVPAFYGKAGA